MSILNVTTDSVSVKASEGIGSLTEPSPTTDTASSGLNGRLQRIAQRLASLIALVPTALTASGNFKTSLAEMTTTLAGEDIPNDRLKVEQRFSNAYCVADTAVKSGEGFLHTLTFSQTDAAPTAGTIIVYDNTAESGTILYSETFDTSVFHGYSVILDCTFSNGLYVGFTTTADIACSVSYR
jgi:hypothetical protein